MYSNLLVQKCFVICTPVTGSHTMLDIVKEIVHVCMYWMLIDKSNISSHVTELETFL